MPRHPYTRDDEGFNVFGYLSSAVGLGSAARLTLEVLAERHDRYACIDETLGVFAPELPSVPCPRVTDLSALPYAVNLFHQNPFEIRRGWLRWRRRLGLDVMPHVNAMVPFWELPRLPADWAQVMSMMDAVLVPTSYIGSAIESSISADRLPRLLSHPTVVTPPSLVVPNRARWVSGRESTTVFLVTFDVRSEVQRKNPWSAIEAFRRAFTDRDDVTLLIKANNAATSEQAEHIRRLEALESADPRVVLLRAHLSREDLWELHASCDAYISLHRAEGLGLGLMESMAVGNPVIATGWSGNMDFMDSANSFPVPFHLVPVSGVTHVNYVAEAHQSWAEPDLDAAASALRVVAGSAQIRDQIGGAARDSIQSRFEQFRRGEAFDTLLEMSEAGVVKTAAHAARVRSGYAYADSGRYAPAVLAAAAKRALVGGLRAVRLKAPAPAGEIPYGPPRILSDSDVEPDSISNGVVE